MDTTTELAIMVVTEVEQQEETSSTKTVPKEEMDIQPRDLLFAEDIL